MSTMTEAPPAREWTDVGQEYSNGRQSDILREASQLRWVPPEGQFPFSPGWSLKHAIEVLEIPNVQRVAYNGSLRYPDGPETATYGLLGIEAQYKNGRVRLYLLDTGCAVVPLLVEHWASS